MTAELNRQAIQRERVLTLSNQDMTANRITIEYHERHLEKANQRELAQEEEIAQLRRDSREHERSANIQALTSTLAYLNSYIVCYLAVQCVTQFG